MLAGIIGLCGLGYMFMEGNLGMSHRIVGDTTDNATIVAENSTYYDQGEGLIVQSDFMGLILMIMIPLLFGFAALLALKGMNKI
jgi:hypothetical protein